LKPNKKNTKETGFTLVNFATLLLTLQVQFVRLDRLRKNLNSLQFNQVNRFFVVITLLTPSYVIKMQ